MRTARFLAVMVAPVVIVACAVGTAPVEGGGVGSADGGGAGDPDSSYGTTGDGGPVGATDSGSSNTDGGGVKDSGTSVPDSGTVGVAGLDCSGSTSSSGESYDSECDDELAAGTESDCSKGGGECSAGTCCRSSTECNNFFIGDFFSPQCVPK